jgi:hypothetical protein
MVEGRRDSRVLEQRLDLRGEDDALPVVDVVERLDPEPVTGEHQPTPPPIPEGERKHPPQRVQERGPAVLVEMRDHLRVAVGRQAVPAAAQVRREILRVVDLTVVHDDDVAGLVRHGLRAALDVDDAQAAHPEPHRTFDEEAVIVRAPVPDRRRHPFHDRRSGRVLVPVFEHTGYATHEVLRRGGSA